MKIPLSIIERSERDYISRVSETDVPLEFPALETASLEEGPKGFRDMMPPSVILDSRNVMLRDVAIEPLDFARERAIGGNDSVYSNFIDLIQLSKSPVGRITLRKGIKVLGYATGFMVSPRLFMTNHHVFGNPSDARDSVVDFNYEYDSKGNKPKGVITFGFDPEKLFISSEPFDYCLLAVSEKDDSGIVGIGDIGFLPLNPGLGKLGEPNGKEALNIIHHPEGDYKQLSIRENRFIRIDGKSIWYSSDTARGSSGSPVFNDQFQVVAIHSSGVPKRNEEGRCIDRHGQVIESDGRTIDESRVVWIANSGIRISVLLEDVLQRKVGGGLMREFRETLLKKPGSATNDKPKTDAGSGYETGSSQSPTHTPGIEVSKVINISVPPSALEKTGNLSIHLSQHPSISMDRDNLEGGRAYTHHDGVLLQEIKKLEGETDYGDCKGYMEDFLGADRIVPLPTPNRRQLRFAARIIDSDDYVLRYHHYSVIFHSVRRMPFISAINVEGDLGSRKDKSDRDDNWLRDRRIDFDIQLNDSYYRGSKFDKGHMSRREDANWGRNASDALRNANMTCMYTNACPQSPKLNRIQKSGVWGSLEKAVLERGVNKEDGKTSRISVFNGPIFDPEDRPLKGVQIPMSYFKVVAWLTDGGALRATAFRLSQKELVGDIEFDESFGLEQLDIDKDPEFKAFGIGLNHLQKLTGLDFSALYEYDTYEKGEDEETEFSTVDELEMHFKRLTGG